MHKKGEIMNTVTFQMEDQKVGQLVEVARTKGLSVDELLQQITDDYLARSPHPSACKTVEDAVFQKALTDSACENEELLRRLAK